MRVVSCDDCIWHDLCEDDETCGNFLTEDCANFLLMRQKEEYFNEYMKYLAEWGILVD